MFSFIEIDGPDGGLNPFSSITLDGQAATSTNQGAEEFEPTTSACSGQKGEGTGKKRKQSQIAGVLENYLEFKKQHSQKVLQEMTEAPKPEDKFTIEKCGCSRSNGRAYRCGEGEGVKIVQMRVEPRNLHEYKECKRPAAMAQR